MTQYGTVTQNIGTPKSAGANPRKPEQSPSASRGNNNRARAALPEGESLRVAWPMPTPSPQRTKVTTRIWCGSIVARGCISAHAYRRRRHTVAVAVHGCRRPNDKSEAPAFRCEEFKSRESDKCHQHELLDS